MQETFDVASILILMIVSALLVGKVWEWIGGSSQQGGQQQSGRQQAHTNGQAVAAGKSTSPQPAR